MDISRIRRVTAAFFSATGNTRKVTEAAASRMAEELGAELCVFDFTLPKSRNGALCFGEDGLLVIGLPVYAGRLPNKLLDFLRVGFSGEGAFAAALVTYGNRSYGSALAELASELSKSGFTVCAAAALPARHAFTDALAPGRPNGEDMLLLDRFSAEAAKNAADRAPLDAAFLSQPISPYYSPLGEDGLPAVFLKAKPVTDAELCTRCGLCAELCPMGSIEKSDPASVSGVCIKCQTCIRSCPGRAKSFADPAFLSHVRMLEKNFTKPQKPEFFV